jgi:hypothetical protein
MMTQRKSGLLGDYASLKEMDNADYKLETGTESLYY